MATYSESVPPTPSPFEFCFVLFHNAFIMMKMALTIEGTWISKIVRSALIAHVHLLFAVSHKVHGGIRVLFSVKKL